MRRCAQSSQRSTCPPSAAVRQRSIALITFSWSRLTCPRLASRQAGPWSRKISATSRIGRPTSAALTPPVRAYASSSVAGECRQAARADSRWRRSDLWPHVCSAPSCPDDADIGLLFQKMGGKAVPQRVNTDTFGNAGALGCHANEPVELAPTHVLSPVAGEQPGLAGMHPSLVARGAPPFTQYIEQVGRENDVAILLAPRFREGRLLPCSTRITIRSLSMSVSFSDTTSDDRRPVA